jgi:hypothetical protein
MRCPPTVSSIIAKRGWKSVDCSRLASSKHLYPLQRRKLLTPMMGRVHLTKIAATVADEFGNRPARWDRSLIPANRSICSTRSTAW